MFNPKITRLRLIYNPLPTGQAGFGGLKALTYFCPPKWKRS
jgi:hypothetical protein